MPGRVAARSGGVSRVDALRRQRNHRSPLSSLQAIITRRKPERFCASMDRVDAINWMEQWADRHEVQLAPVRRLRPGESYVGLVRPLADQVLSFEALGELLPMCGQLTFKEMGPPPDPAPGSPEGAGGDLGEGEGSSPPTNRGDRVTMALFKGYEVGKSLYVGVDQFTLVGHGVDARQGMLAVLQSYLGVGQAGLYGHNTYKSSWCFECGAELNWTDGRDDWCVALRGRTLQLVGEEKHVQFLIDTDRYAHHCTRVDCRLDDYSRKLIDLQLVREAREAGNFVGPRKSQIIEDGRNVGGRLKLEGATYAFGTRDSTRVIFYDKGLQSKGLICSNRCEAGYYKDKAAAAWVKLISAARSGVSSFTRAAGELVCGAVDFRLRGDHKHLSRMPRLSWWAAVVDLLGSIRVKIERIASTLNSSLTSMIRQYGRKIGRAAAVAEGLGYDLALQFVHAIDRLRQGQELEDRELSPLEAAFDPRCALRIT